MLGACGVLHLHEQLERVRINPRADNTYVLDTHSYTQTAPCRSFISQVESFWLLQNSTVLHNIMTSLEYLVRTVTLLQLHNLCSRCNQYLQLACNVSENEKAETSAIVCRLIHSRVRQSDLTDNDRSRFNVARS